MNAQTPEATGVFPSACWRRPSAHPAMAAPKSPYQSQRSELARMSSRAILDLHLGSCRHTQRRTWTVRDRAIHDELISRTFGVGEISKIRFCAVPRWVEPFLCRVTDTGRRMNRRSWAPMLAFVIAAFRRGAAGVRLTYDELAAELGCGRRTVARYVDEMLEAGLLRRLRVFAEVTQRGAKRKRVQDSNIYQCGPELLKVWHALVEGCSSRVRWGGPNAKRARFAAHELRQLARGHRRDRELEARAQHPSEDAPSIRRADPGGLSVDSRGRDYTAPTFLSDERKTARESAERSCVGASSPPTPDAPAEAEGQEGAPHEPPRAECQVGLTTRSRFYNRDHRGPDGPEPSAGASGVGGEDAPTHERSALGRRSTQDQPGASRRSAKSERNGEQEPRPIAGSTNQANTDRARAPRLAVESPPAQASCPNPSNETGSSHEPERGDEDPADRPCRTFKAESAAPLGALGNPPNSTRGGARVKIREALSKIKSNGLREALRAALPFDESSDD